MYTLTNGIYAVGLFETLEDAEQYRTLNEKYWNFQTMEILIQSM